jgi:pSer/pThr/pTyr-binding forkhead associated (FHA) protein
VPVRDVKEWETIYKYSCRKCPIRARCILKSDASPAIKEAIRNAFANRTDTNQMWGILQENCLLIKEEEEAKQRVGQESMLSQRLRRARMVKEPAATQEPTPPLEAVPPTIFPAPPRSPPTVPTEAPVRPSPTAPTEAPAHPPKEGVAAYYLIVQPSKRRIALPDEGELVLGRFDPSISLLTDVDLRHDDQGRMTVSRRHAKISGFRGTHIIEDLGSTNGTRLNDRLLKLGEFAPLRPGDRITLGKCQLSYEPAPEWLAELPAEATCNYFLLVTATGHRFDLPANPGEVIIGRADPMVDAEPDIDLRGEGEIGIRVSRRHARLTWEKGGHFLEDMGSTFGTRVSGSVVQLGDRVRLRPGDHIWLGGCGLAYDLELEQHDE